MYGKIFQSLYQGTLCGRANEILVFTNLLAFKDRRQYVDKHPRVIAFEVGIPEAEVREALKSLEAPDPESRSEAEGGARIIRADDHREWGWYVVNGAKYDAMRNMEVKQEQDRVAQAKRRAKLKNGHDDAEPTNADDGLTESDNSDSQRNQTQSPSGSGSGSGSVAGSDLTHTHKGAHAHEPDPDCWTVAERIGRIWGRQGKSRWASHEFDLVREHISSGLFTDETIGAVEAYIPTCEAKFRGSVQKFLQAPHPYIDRATTHGKPAKTPETKHRSSIA